MSNSAAVAARGNWPISAGPAAPSVDSERTYSAASILDFPTLVRIIRDWRWLVLGAIAAALAAAVLATMLTTPVYRAWVTLEASPPSFSVSDAQSREREESNSGTYEFLVTQMGLLSSKSVAQRTAE